jgi:hypothetical protein
MRELRTSGSAGGEGGNILAYPAAGCSFSSIIEAKPLPGELARGVTPLPRARQPLSGVVQTCQRRYFFDATVEWPANARRNRTSTCCVTNEVWRHRLCSTTGPASPMAANTGSRDG